MRIALIDVDGHNFPNLPLMKLSAWHKQNGDQIEWYDPLTAWLNPPDRVYMSKVFTFTPDYPHPVCAGEIIKGGTGYEYPSGGKPLPEEIEHIYPDYSLYPELCRDTAYGFLTRGCPRGCDFCIVKEKEGQKSHNGSYFYAEKMKEMRYMRMEQANYIKAIFTAIFAFLSALLGVLAVPVILLVACNLIDYMTGLMASKYRAEDINSYKSIRGIFKKVSMWLLVVVGAIIDEMLLYASTTIGWKSPVAFLIACVVAMWLICNEIISILENIQDMGVKIPAFLQPLVKHIRSQVEEQINTEKIEEKDSEGE